MPFWLKPFLAQAILAQAILAQAILSATRLSFCKKFICIALAVTMAREKREVLNWLAATVRKLDLIIAQLSKVEGEKLVRATVISLDTLIPARLTDAAFAVSKSNYASAMLEEAEPVTKDKEQQDQETQCHDEAEEDDATLVPHAAKKFIKYGSMAVSRSSDALAMTSHAVRKLIKKVPMAGSKGSNALATTVNDVISVPHATNDLCEDEMLVDPISVATAPQSVHVDECVRPTMVEDSDLKENPTNHVPDGLHGQAQHEQLQEDLEVFQPYLPESIEEIHDASCWEPLPFLSTSDAPAVRAVSRHHAFLAGLEFPDVAMESEARVVFLTLSVWRFKTGLTNMSTDCIRRMFSETGFYCRTDNVIYKVAWPLF